MKTLPSSTKQTTYRSTHASGFTLVEVLTVIAIISILMTAGAIGLGNLTAGKGTTSAVATCESLFDEARTIAVSKRCSARVLIDVNSAASDNYLRRVVIAHQKINADGTVDATKWVMAGRGYTMPNGTYFSNIYSTKQAGGAVAQESMTLYNDAATPTVMAEYSSKKYAFYEFNAEGIFLDPGARFIVASGVRPKNAQPKTTAGAKLDFGGFVTWRNGSTSTFRNPEQMGIPASVTTF